MLNWNLVTKQHVFWSLDWFIWMSHWRCQATEGAELWFSCKRPAFLSNSSRLQLIQNSAISVARRRQCDIRWWKLSVWKKFAVWTINDVLKIIVTNFIIDRSHYGNMCCGVFKRVIQKWKDFCLRINLLNFVFRINGDLSKNAKTWHSKSIF